MSARGKLRLTVLALTVLAGGGLVTADMGSIPMPEDDRLVDVFEPNQRALIAWNGQEEILILSTDLQASRPTRVLEVIPLPSEPTVTAGDTAVFQRAVDLLNQKLPKKRLPARSGASGATGLFGDDAGEAEAPPAAEVTLHKRVGATDISVIHVLTGDRFIQWVEDYLKGQSVKNPTIPPIMKKTVQEYLADGYQWFAFNIVVLSREVHSKDAVQYRFKTDCLFYPMRISRTDKGKTQISLIILTREELDSLRIVGVTEGWVTLAYGIVRADVDVEPEWLRA